MNAAKYAGAALIVAGTLGLAYGGISYTKEVHEVNLGFLAFVVEQKETVKVPVWASVGAMVIGGALLLVFGRKR